MNANGGFRLMLCCCAVALGVAGCGGSDSSESADTGTVRSTPAQTTTTPAVKPIENPYTEKPALVAHPGAKIDHLIIKDIKKGTGTELQAGDTGIFDFIGSNYITGKPLDAAWHRKRGPFETVVDHGVVIDGWWQGIPGMRVGGRRQLIVPPSLGFNNTGNPAVEGITPYFDVVLLGVIPATPAGIDDGQGTTGASAGG